MLVHGRHNASTYFACIIGVAIEPKDRTCRTQNNKINHLQQRQKQSLIQYWHSIHHHRNATVIIHQHITSHCCLNTFKKEVVSRYHNQHCQKIYGINLSTKHIFSTKANEAIIELWTTCGNQYWATWCVLVVILILSCFGGYFLL